MRLGFDVTEDDFWAGQEHLMFKAPEMKRYFRWVYAFLAVMLFVFMPLLMLLTIPLDRALPGLLGILIGGGVGMLIMFLALRLGTRLSRPLSRRFFRKVIDQAIGHHELEIVPKGLHIYTAHGEQIVYWDSIGNIATSPEHTFIYLTRMQSVIVPQKRISSGNYHAFMQAFADVYANRRDVARQATPLGGTAQVPVPAVSQNSAIADSATETVVQQVHS